MQHLEVPITNFSEGSNRNSETMVTMSNIIVDKPTVVVDNSENSHTGDVSKIAENFDRGLDHISKTVVDNSQSKEKQEQSSRSYVTEKLTTVKTKFEGEQESYFNGVNAEHDYDKMSLHESNTQSNFKPTHGTTENVEQTENFGHENINWHSRRDEKR